MLVLEENEVLAVVAEEAVVTVADHLVARALVLADVGGNGCQMFFWYEVARVEKREFGCGAEAMV